MSYYITRVVFECPRCKRLATYEVHGHRNESYGNFCKLHAEQLIKRLNENEERQRIIKNERE